MLQSIIRNSLMRTPGALRARTAAVRLCTATTLLCVYASAQADQFIVTTANSDGNAIYDLTLSPSSLPLKPVIVATTIDSDGSKHGSYDSLVWATNSYCKTLDLIVADSSKGQILRYAGASTLPNCYNPAKGMPGIDPTAQVIFSWTKIGSGPAQPTGLAADAYGNVFAISSSSHSDPKASIWVLPFNSTANLYCSSVAAGGYCAPVLVDDRLSSIPASLLTDTLVTSTTTQFWNQGDLLVLVGDSYDASLLVYSKRQLYGSNGLIAIHSLNLLGPTDTAIPYSKFHQQLAQPSGMDIWPANNPAGSHAALLFTTLDGRILTFDLVDNKFVSNFASGLGNGLERIKVGEYTNVPYAFVSQTKSNNTGQILAFGTPTSSTNKALATFSTGLKDPIGLSVVNYGSTPTPPSCSHCVDTVDPLGTEAVTTFTPPPGVSFPGTISEQSCIVQNDPRVTASLSGNTLTSWSCTGVDLPIGAGTAYCPSFPAAVIPGSLCGHSGPTASGFAVIEGTALGLDPADNNTFFQTALNIDTVLPGPNNLECANFPTTGQIPLTAWGPRSDLVTVEGTIVEDFQTGYPNLSGAPGYLADMTSYCDTSTTGGHGISIFAFGLGLSSTSQSYVYGLQNQKYQALLQTVAVANMLPTVQSQLATDVSAAETYVNAAEGGVNVTGNLDCALAQIYATDQYLRSNLTAFSSNLGSGASGGGDPDPAGEIDSRLAAWYLTLNTEILGIQPPTPPAATGYPLPFPIPASSVPTCVPPQPQYSVGGSITGHSGSGLQLQDSNGDTLQIPDSGTSFSFPADLLNGATYNVNVQYNAYGEVCSVTNGYGSISGANVTNISVSCLGSTPSAAINSFTLDYGYDESFAVLAASNAVQCNFITLYGNSSPSPYYQVLAGNIVDYVSIGVSYSSSENPEYPPTGAPGYGTDTFAVTCYGDAGTQPVTASALNVPPGAILPGSSLAISGFGQDEDGGLGWATSPTPNNAVCSLIDEFGGPLPPSYGSPPYPIASPITGLPGSKSGYLDDNSCAIMSIPFYEDTLTLTCTDPNYGTAIATTVWNPGCGG